MSLIFYTLHQKICLTSCPKCGTKEKEHRQDACDCAAE